MDKNHLQINTQSFHDNNNKYLLAEYVRGKEEVNPSDQFFLEENKGEERGRLTLIDDKYEAESICGKRSQIENHAIGYVEGGVLRVVKVPYYFYMCKRIKPETQKAVRRNSMSYAEKKELVVQEVGTNKSKKMLKNQKTRTIDESKIASLEQLQNMIGDRAEGLREQTAALKASESSKKLASLKELLPPFNEQARHPAEIYSVATLIPKACFAEIKGKDFAKRVADKNLSKALLQIVDSLAIDLSQLEEEAAKGWSYLDMMLHVFPMRRISRPVNELAVQKGLSPNVLSQIVGFFYEKHSKEGQHSEHVKTNKSNLKFVSHITVLFLLLNKLKCEVLPLHSTLGVPEQELPH